MSVLVVDGLYSLSWYGSAGAGQLLWDVIRNRTVHKAYLVWLGLLVVFAVATQLLWDTPSWHAFISRLLGP